MAGQVGRAGSEGRVLFQRVMSDGSALDGLEVFSLVIIAERKGNASRSRPPGAADSMDVGFRLMWEIVVHDVGDSLDVDAREATSVATRTCVLSDLKSAKVLCRAAWLLFPWIASGRMPDCFNCARRDGAVLGAGKNQCSKD